MGSRGVAGRFFPITLNPEPRLSFLPGFIAFKCLTSERSALSYEPAQYAPKVDRCALHQLRTQPFFPVSNIFLSFALILLYKAAVFNEATRFIYFG